MRPRYSQSSHENVTPSSGTSTLASYKEVPTPPPQVTLTPKATTVNFCRNQDEHLWCWDWYLWYIPLSPDSDQHQFSPNNIQWSSRDTVMRINKWSPKRKYLDLLLNSLDWCLKEMYGDQFGESVCWYLDLKGYRVHSFGWIWIKIYDSILMVMMNQRNQSRTHRYLWYLNPLSPNSDQHQFSPNNMHRLSSATSMRVNQMIIKRKISDLLSISPN